MMNERIRELTEQATRIEESDELFLREVFDKEKFAELIVRECAEVAAKVGEGYVKMGYVVPLECSNKIKEHFGVE